MARVLLVTDDPAVSKQVEWALKPDGHNIETISLDEAAFNRIRFGPPGPPDLLIMDGIAAQLKLVRPIRRDPVLEHLPLFVLLNRAEQDGLHESGVANHDIEGVDLYLTKPFDSAQLRLFVRRILVDPTSNSGEIIRPLIAYESPWWPGGYRRGEGG